MALLFTILSTLLSAGTNATTFAGTNFTFSRLTDHGKQERKRHDLALAKLQKARDQWNEDRMKRLDFINKKLREQNKVYIITAYINDTNQAILEYHRIFAKK